MKPQTPRQASTGFRRQAPGLLLLLLVTQAGAQPPPPAPKAPANVSAIPDYGDSSITVRWTDNPDETGYILFKAERAAGPFKRIANLAANVVQYKDAGPLARNKEFFYKLKAQNAGGLSPYSKEAQQNLKILWPVPATHEILHEWNDTIGRAGANGGYHEGVDIQRVGKAADNKVNVPRGGVVTDVGRGAKNDNFVYIKVVIGATTEYDSFNHLQDGLSVKKDQAVYSGQLIGTIGTGHFPVKFTDHTHFYVVDRAYGDGIKHPLSIFPTNADRDPQGNKPAIIDHAAPADGTLLFQRQGAGKGVYIEHKADTKPLGDDKATADDEANLDIIVEMSDVQGTKPDQVPMKVAYWIEGPRPPVAGLKHDNVGTAAWRYMLFDFSTVFFGKGATVPAWKDLMDEDKNLGPTIKEGGETYPATWDNYKHVIVTNTKDKTGAKDKIAKDQYWNTNAKNDKSDPAGDKSNMAGKPDTAKAHEARFPDGEYRIHIHSEDLVNTNDEKIEDIRLENYPPIIKSVLVYQDFDGKANTPANGEHKGYEKKIYAFDHLNPDAYKVTPADIKTYRVARAEYGPVGTGIWVKIVFSETIDKAWKKGELMIDIKNDGEDPYEAGPDSWIKLYVKDDTAIGTTFLEADKGEDDAIIIVKQQDRIDRKKKQRGMDADSDGKPQADSTDRNHVFLVCSDQVDANKNRIGDICEPTPTPTSTATKTPTKTPTPTSTRTPTWTYTPTYTSTYTPTRTSTPTPVSTFTATPQLTPIPSLTAIETVVRTGTPSATASGTASPQSPTPSPGISQTPAASGTVTSTPDIFPTAIDTHPGPVRGGPIATSAALAPVLLLLALGLAVLGLRRNKPDRQR